MDKRVLLTGATGFLGSRLCRSLLERLPHNIFCLVRGRTPEGGARRLHARLGLDPALRERVIPVAGDVRLPRLGLSEADHDKLADAVGAVYHCAASVNLAADYDRLAPSNVEGTRHVIAFARHRRPKHLHHISTLGTFIAGGPHLTVDETSIPERVTAGGIGYCETKCVGEAEVRAAGIPATIYRPAIILGDTVTGECSSSDAVARMIRAGSLLDTVPRTNARVPVGTVDFTADAIALLSQCPDIAGQAFHPVQDPAFPLQELFTCQREAGYARAEADVADWHALMTAAPGSSAAFVMLAVWRAARHILAETPSLHPPMFEAGRTRKLLADAGVAAGPLDPPYFGRMFARLLRR